VREKPLFKTVRLCNKRFDSIPILVSVSTTAPETSSYEPPTVLKALNFLRARKGRVAALHRKRSNQTLVTVTLTAPLKNPRIELARDGLNGAVSLDGMPQPPPLKQ
jgi:hypothetical protein